MKKISKSAAAVKIDKQNQWNKPWPKILGTLDRMPAGDVHFLGECHYWIFRPPPPPVHKNKKSYVGIVGLY